MVGCDKFPISLTWRFFLGKPTSYSESTHPKTVYWVLKNQKFTISVSSKIWENFDYSLLFSSRFRGNIRYTVICSFSIENDIINIFHAELMLQTSKTEKYVISGNDRWLGKIPWDSFGECLECVRLLCWNF